MGAITVYYEATSGTDYTKSDDKPINAGTYAVTVNIVEAANFAGIENLLLGDFTITKATPTANHLVYALTAATYDGNQHGIDPPELKEAYSGMGDITVYYEATSGTDYTKSDDKPINAGTYAVTVNIVEAANFAGIENLSLGDFTIGKATPAATHLNFTLPASVTYDGTAKSVPVTLKTSDYSGMGNITVRYNGSADKPTNAGVYAVTVDIDGSGNNFEAISNLELGTFSIHKATPAATHLDFTLPASVTYDGTEKSVPVTLKTPDYSNMGAITVKYNGSADKPTNAGDYTITVDIDGSGNNFEGVEELLLGDFIIAKAPQPITFDPVAEWKVEDGNYALIASVPSGLPVEFRVSDTSLAEIDGSSFIPKQAGEVTVTAYVAAADSNYLPAEEVSRVIMLNSNSTSVTDLSVVNAVRQDDGVWVVDCDYTGTTVTVNVVTGDASAVVEYKGKQGNHFTVDVSRPGVHTETFTVTAPDNTRREHQFRTERRLDYDKLVIQRWNNTLLINNNTSSNGGYTFTAYQWYREDEPITGATEQFYSAGDKATDLLDNVFYHAALTTAEGEKLRTCPAKPSTLTLKTLVAYPNPVHSGELLRLDTGMSDEQLQGAELRIYSVTGTLVLRQKITGGNPVELQLNLPSGVYVLYVNEQQVRLLVNE
jgi:hypothetical protein